MLLQSVIINNTADPSTTYVSGLEYVRQLSSQFNDVFLKQRKPVIKLEIKYYAYETEAIQKGIDFFAKRIRCYEYTIKEVNTYKMGDGNLKRTVIVVVDDNYEPNLSCLRKALIRMKLVSEWD